MFRPDKLFGHRLWMTPLASYVGLSALLYGAWSIGTGRTSGYWLLPALFFTFCLLMGITVGMHRLFCHASFKTNKFWQAVLAFFGTLAIYGSTVQWPAMHAMHHRYSDTGKDPHYTGWRYLFWKKNRPTTFHRRTVLRQYRNPIHRFLHQYYALIVASVVLLLTLTSLNALVFCYLIPLGWLHFVGSIHQVFAHGRDGPRDQWWLELLLWTGGEWLHGHHHDKPRDIRFGRFDVGYHVIRTIRSAPETLEQ